MFRINTWIWIAIIVSLVALMTGCRNSRGNVASVGTGGTHPDLRERVLRIGYQKGSPLNVLRVRGDLDRRMTQEGIRVEWLDFPAGPQLLEALAAGSLDLGYTGDAPVAFALAAGQPIVYVANAPSGDETGESRGILVPNNSPIRSVRDLRGKRIAVQKGSSTHSLLIQVLETAGIAYKDVHIVYLAPPDARPAFESGSVDAWAIWDPYLAIAQHSTGARTLITGRGVVTAGAFYVSSRDAIRNHSDWIRVALAEMDSTGKWMVSHAHEAATLLAPAMRLDVAILEEAQRRSQPHDGRYIGIHPVDEKVLKLQQTVADNFSRIGLLPPSVDVRSGLLSPQETAGVLPQTFLSSASTSSIDSRDAQHSKPGSEKSGSEKSGSEKTGSERDSKRAGGTR